MAARFTVDLKKNPEVADVVSNLGIGDEVEVVSTIVAMDEQSITLEIDNNAAAQGAQKAKVLIIDDDRLCQKLVSKVYSNAGHETLLAGNAKEAWERLYEHLLVDMIVLDNQLEQEWGWQFLRTLRAHPAYKGVPVIVYTGHTERESIVRYLELGIQSVNMKPYLSDVLLSELSKALTSNWVAQVIEPTEVICDKMGLTPDQYASLLATADSTITEKLRLTRARMASSSSSQIFAALASIEQQCRSVGVLAIDGVVSQIKKNINDENLIAAFEGLRAVDSFVGIIRQRMLKMLEMSGSVAQSGLIIEKRAKEPEAELHSTASFSAAYVRETINKPLWRFGPHLRRAIQHPLMSKEELSALTTRMAGVAPFTSLNESLAVISSIPTQSIDSAIQLCWETNGYLKTYQYIHERVNGSQIALNSKKDLQDEMDNQGFVKILAMAMLARIANKLPRESTLNLRPLCEHTFTTALIAFEMGRLLKLKNSYMLLAAGLAHEIGRWLYSFGEPGLTGLALALAADGDTTIEDAELKMFGENHHQAGMNLLAALSQSELLQATALDYHNPAGVKDPENIIIVTVTHLANLLATVSAAGSAPEGKEILNSLRNPQYPSWNLLVNRGVSLPLEIPELVQTLEKISQTGHWIAVQLLNKAL